MTKKITEELVNKQALSSNTRIAFTLVYPASTPLGEFDAKVLHMHSEATDLPLVATTYSTMFWAEALHQLRLAFEREPNAMVRNVTWSKPAAYTGANTLWFAGKKWLEPGQQVTIADMIAAMEAWVAPPRLTPVDDGEGGVEVVDDQPVYRTISIQQDAPKAVTLASSNGAVTQQLTYDHTEDPDMHKLLAGMRGACKVMVLDGAVVHAEWRKGLQPDSVRGMKALIRACWASKAFYEDQNSGTLRSGPCYRITFSGFFRVNFDALTGRRHRLMNALRELLRANPPGEAVRSSFFQRTIKYPAGKEKICANLHNGGRYTYLTISASEI